MQSIQMQTCNLGTERNVLNGMNIKFDDLFKRFSDKKEPEQKDTGQGKKDSSYQSATIIFIKKPFRLKYYLLLFLILTGWVSGAQNPVEFSLKNSTLAATDSLLPFWFSANQNGKIEAAGSFLNFSDLYIGQDYPAADSAFSLTWGGNVVAALGEKNYFQVNRFFAGISFKGWELKGGMFYDAVRYAGLSTSNGNISRSHNARPYPLIRVSTRGYKLAPIFSNWLTFKAEYDEGILNDNRFVDKARMHHKSFYLRIQPAKSWEISAGLEHFVMWNGTSADEQEGRLPSGFDAYLRYIFGLKGNEDFNLNDILNVAGNQLGTWQLEAQKHFSGADVTFYVSHYFEDYSGVNWRNWRDNLLGLHIGFKVRERILNDFVYEFTNTRNQSIVGKIWQGPDNYFNHGIYRSGYTYHQQVIGSPLIFPVVLRDGIARGVRSNRFFAHHLGICGKLSNYLHWKGMLTYIEHWGTYGSPYNTYRKQLSGLLEAEYINPGFPVELGLSLSADAGNTISKNGAVQFWIAKTW